MRQKLYLYPKFERFWHWAQALLIIFLLLTGFEIHGSFKIWGFEKAYLLHVYLGFSLIGLTLFAIFWHLTTGAWRHYWPVKEKLPQICYYYAVGIFRGEPHPFEKRPDQKLNPLQRLAYLFLKLFLYPGQMITGVLLFLYPWWLALGIKKTFPGVVYWHMIGAFAFLFFLIIHVYLTTTGKPWYSHIRGMILGWEEYEESSSKFV